MISRLKYTHIVIITVSAVLVFNAIPYFFKYHTYWNGIGVKYNNPLFQRVFVENLKYYGISYIIDEENIIWYTRSNEDKVQEIDRKSNHKLVNSIDLDYEVTKLKNIGYEVVSINYHEPNKTLLMWFDNN